MAPAGVGGNSAQQIHQANHPSGQLPAPPGSLEQLLGDSGDAQPVILDGANRSCVGIKHIVPAAAKEQGGVHVSFPGRAGKQ